MNRFTLLAILKNIDLVKGTTPEQLEQLLKKINESEKSEILGAINMYLVDCYENAKKEV